jgi:hypothetical protein
VQSGRSAPVYTGEVVQQVQRWHLEFSLAKLLNFVARLSQPNSLHPRLQPAMAAIVAIRDGIRDARAGRSPYLWTVAGNSRERVGRLREGLIATAAHYALRWPRAQVIGIDVSAKTRVRRHAAHGRNFGHLSIACDRRIRGVCLSRGDRLGRLFDGEDLLRH